jgi:CHAT domain-containing protein/uncharacterized protein HemY
MIEVQGGRVVLQEAPGQKLGMPGPLKAIQDGVLFDGKDYWCRSELPPFNAKFTPGTTAVCQSTGWATEKLAAETTAAQPDGSKDQTAEADRLFKLGVEQVERNENDAALKSLQQALTIYQATGNRVGQMDALRYIGWAQHQLKNYPKALEQFQQSLAIAQATQNLAGEAKVLNGFASVYEAQKESDKALASYEKARTIAVDIKDRKVQAIILANMARFYRSANNSPKEIEVLNQNLALYRDLKQPEDERYTLTDLAIVYGKLKDYQQAIGLHQQSLAIDKQLNNRSGMANTWRNLGISYDAQKDYPNAISAFNQSLSLYRELKNPANVAKLLNNLGLSYTAQKAYPQAIAAFEEGITIYSQLNDRSNAAQQWRNIASAHEAQQQFSQAIPALEKSLAIRRELKETELVTPLLLSLGLAQQKAKNYPQAIPYYEAYLTASRQQQGFKQEALILKIIGDLYRLQDATQENSEKALKYYNESLKISEKQGDQADINHAIHGMAIVYEQDQKFKLAVEHFHKALKGWRQLNNKVMEANALLLLGNMYSTSSGNEGETWCPQGLGYLEQSLELLRELKDPGSQTIAVGLLGTCYQLMQQPDKAIDYLNQSLAIAQQNRDPLQEGIMLVNLGRSYQAKGDLAQAQTVSEKGLSNIRTVKNPRWEVFALEHLSSIYVARSADQKAIAAQTEKIILSQKHNIRLVTRGFNAVSVNIEQAKNFNQAQHQRQQYAWYSQALIKQGFAVDQIGVSTANITDFTFYLRDALISLGDAYVKAGNDAKALTFYQAALAPDYEKGYSYGFIDIDLLGKLGETLARLGRFSEAEKMMRLALKYGEEFRTGLGYGTGSSAKKWSDADRIFLAERKVKNFRQLQQVLVRQNRPNEALETAEEARARTFVELLAARTSGQPLGKELPPAPKLDEIRQIAKTQNATLVQYSLVGSDLLYSWVIKPSGEVTFHATQLDPKQPLKQLVASGRSEMGVRGRLAISKIDRADDQPSTPSSRQGNLAKLHQLLIDPIAPDLPKDPSQRVIFLPQGELFLVPFAALPNAQGKYLIERHTIVTAPSIQTLTLTHQQAQKIQAKPIPATGRSVVVGDPTMPIYQGTALRPLPGARQEALAIAKFLNTSPLLGEQATKSAVLAQIQSANMIHFATHGLLDTVQGDMPGAIALAPSGPDSGLLSASEIFDLKLNAQLVVLSACDTGRGQITGDGVVGLSRSLIAAGAPSVLVSLWAVDDGSTRYLMGEFYRNLDQRQDKAQALRNAMLTTMKQYPLPSDWAAFTLIGESN